MNGIKTGDDIEAWPDVFAEDFKPLTAIYEITLRQFEDAQTYYDQLDQSPAFTPDQAETLAKLGHQLADEITKSLNNNPNLKLDTKIPKAIDDAFDGQVESENEAQLLNRRNIPFNFMVSLREATLKEMNKETAKALIELFKTLYEQFTQAGLPQLLNYLEPIIQLMQNVIK